MHIRKELQGKAGGEKFAWATAMAPVADMCSVGDEVSSVCDPSAPVAGTHPTTIFYGVILLLEQPQWVEVALR